MRNRCKKVEKDSKRGGNVEKRMEKDRKGSREGERKGTGWRRLEKGKTKGQKR